MAEPNVVDADFEYVAGPMRPGDEHPGRRGWFYTGERDPKGELLWYKPPSRVWVWVRRVCWALWFGGIAFGVLTTIVFNGP